MAPAMETLSRSSRRASSLPTPADREAWCDHTARPRRLGRRSFGLLLLAALSLGPRGAQATAVGNLFSGPTSADAATVYWNPAAMTLISGTQSMLFGGATFLRGQYNRDTKDPFSGKSFPPAYLDVIKPDPAPFVVTDFGLKRWRFGFGIVAPVIDGASWELSYGGQPSSTRYYAIQARIVEFMVEPAVGFQVNRWLSLGFGIDVIGMWVTQTLMTDMGARVNQLACAMTSGTNCQLDAPLARENPAYDALTKVSGTGFSAGVYGGILLTPWPWLQIGASMHSGGRTMKIPVSMSVDIPKTIVDYVAKNLRDVALPALVAEGNVELGSPLIVKAGVRLAPTAKLDFSADFQWIQKSVMATMFGNVERASNPLVTGQVLVKAWRDEWQIGARSTYWVHPRVRVGLRVEVGPNTRPERYTTPVSLDVTKISLHGGVQWQVHRHVSLNLEYGHYFIFSRTVSQTDFAPNAHPTTPLEEGFDRPLPTGYYNAWADRVGLGLNLYY